ncbi:hypothetical protein BS47DRAFT_1395214 [Hydnum rufescens UP504]|uniref:Uncharacterized protein n=1 Tax=Hydnum rufescens UP504 TaxID=1448309 RepID=A0A9P6ATT8_9AGAM|nr:hypothetical protein BS47DRAFT_1395214 [Hydnum rufescens UP504]
MQAVLSNPWILDPIAIEQQPSSFSQDPSSVLNGSLAGVCWKSSRMGGWLKVSPDSSEESLIMEAQSLKPHPMILTVLSATVHTIQEWMVMVKVCQDLTHAIDLGLLPILSNTALNLFWPEMKATTAFMAAVKSLSF